MKCPSCQADLGKLNAAGEPMVRNHGLILKAAGPAVVCPRCKADVPFSNEMAKALQVHLTLFFKGKAPPKPA